MSAPIILEPSHSVVTKSIIWMHGLGADGNDFAPIANQLQLSGTRFIFPNAPIRPITINNGIPMPGWYDIYSLEDRSKQDKAGILESVQTIHELIESEIQKGIDPSEICLAGFSQGGAIALYAGLTFSKKLKRILALSTYLPIQDEFIKASREVNQDTPIFMAHGMQDEIIPLSYAQKSKDVLVDLGYHLNFQTYPMPHSVCPQEVLDIKAILS